MGQVGRQLQEGRARGLLLSGKAFGRDRTLLSRCTNTQDEQGARA